MQMNMNIGDVRTLTINGSSQKAIVTGVDRVETENGKADLITYDIDNYGRASEYYYPDGGIAGQQAEYRRSRSPMPPEYYSKTWQDFKWDKYGDNVSQVKKIAYAFFERYTDFRKQGRGLYISSKTKGSGKTMLACCLANEIY